MVRDLTDRQHNVLKFICRRIRAGRAPTVREIMAQFGFTSPATVSDILRALEVKGFIRRAPRQSRGLALVEEAVARLFPVKTMDLPVVGTIRAGKPVFADPESEEWLTVKDLMPQATFALRVEGESMAGAELHEGDYVLVRSQPWAEERQIVVAMVNGNEATVKRYLERNGQVILQPENPAYDPITLSREEVTIVGVVVGLYRRLR